MQVSDFGWAIDISQFDAYLTGQQAIVLIAPFYAIAVHVIDLG